MADAKRHAFALAGGTALERFYLHHRVSRDLDYFSTRFNRREVVACIARVTKALGYSISAPGEFVADRRARVIWYMATYAHGQPPLKIDFVEDIVVERPRIRRIEGISVYDVADIYFHKIAALSGTYDAHDPAGRTIATGRNEPRDAFDIYMLSLRVRPLHQFLQQVPRAYQRRFIQWVRSYSRLDMKLGLLDLEIHIEKFDPRDLIVHIDKEAARFVEEIR
jgi:hypothetical protein